MSRKVAYAERSAPGASLPVAVPPVPEAWVRELLLREHPELQGASSDIRLPLTVTISYFPEFPTKLPVALEEIAQDLSAGFRIEPRPGSRGTAFNLEGKRYGLTINAKLGKNRRRPIAVAWTVMDRPKRTLMGARLLVDRVEFREIWDETECDPAELARCFQEGQQAIRRQREAHFHAQERLSQQAEQTGCEAENRLHAAARKNYGALRTLIRLLEQRDRVAAEASEVVGVVTTEAAARAEPEDLLTLQLGDASHGFEPQDRVELIRSTPSAPIRSCVEHTSGLLLHVVQPEGLSFVAGEEVRVRLRPRFAMRSHSLALEKFLKAEVQGKWKHLASLAISPDELDLRAAPAPAQFFAEMGGQILNEEQKTAVAKAVASPHAFFIQGPPGTGKTTVIAEVIQHLVARGERVLLLAPTHVAVDEVLQRVGDKPGILPLRLAWDETKVKEEVRCYTEAQVRDQARGKIRSPGSSLASRWAAERAILEGKLRVLADWSTTLAQSEARTSGCVQAEAELLAKRAVQAELQSEQRRLASDLVNAEANLEACRSTTRECGKWVESASATVNGLEPRGVFGVIKAAVTGQLARLGRAKGELGNARHGFKQAQDAEWHAGERRGHLTENVAKGVKATASCERVLRRLESEFEEAKHLASAARAELGAKTRSTALMILKREEDTREASIELLRIEQVVRRRMQRLVAFPDLESHWFELTGQTRAVNPDRLEQLAEQLGDEVLSAVNLVCCTTTGIASSKIVQGADFDTLIVDEASRVTDSEFFIGAVKARRWILVGDEHQLPPYVEQDDEFFLHALAALHRAGKGEKLTLEAAVEALARLWEEEEELHLFRRDAVLEAASKIRDDGSWEKHYRALFEEAIGHLTGTEPDPTRKLLLTLRDYLVRSLFERCVRDCKPELRQRLVEQRRMIEPIADIVKSPIYNGDYKTPAAGPGGRSVEPLIIAPFNRPVIFLDTTPHGGRAADRRLGNGFECNLERDWVVSLCDDFERELRRRAAPSITVSVLCFYRAQARAIKQQLDPQRFRQLEFQVIDAIDKIQGQESDLVILSFGRALVGRQPGAKYGQWLQDLRRLNVACTRARRGLALVGHQATLKLLNSKPESQRFYAHLFSLFESGSPDFVMVKDYKPHSRR